MIQATKSYFILQETDYKLGVITNQLMLPFLIAIVVWEWEWKDLEEITHASKTSFSKAQESLGDLDLEDSDATYCSTLEREHTITFKCIGAVHDSHD